MAEKKQNTNTTDIEKAMEAKIAEMLAMAQKKAEDLIAEAEAKAEAIIKAKSEILAEAKSAPTAEDEALKKHLAEMEELVPFKAFKDNGKYKDDIFVAVNGESCLIQRGKPVMIKRKFLEALMNSQAQDEYAASYSEGLQNEYEARRSEME